MIPKFDPLTSSADRLGLALRLGFWLQAAKARPVLTVTTQEQKLGGAGGRWKIKQTEGVLDPGL